MLIHSRNGREVHAMVMESPVDACLGVVQCAHPECDAYTALVNDGARRCDEQIEAFLTDHTCSKRGAVCRYQPERVFTTEPIDASELSLAAVLEATRAIGRDGSCDLVFATWAATLVTRFTWRGLTATQLSVLAGWARWYQDDKVEGGPIPSRCGIAAHAIVTALLVLDKRISWPSEPDYRGCLIENLEDKDLEKDLPADARDALTALLTATDNHCLPQMAVESSASETSEPQTSADAPLKHKIQLSLASGATLTLLYFSDREQRWIFAYDYVGEKLPGASPDVANDIRLTADYADGALASRIVLSMHVVVPARLGQQYFAGVDISPGAKTYLELIYERVGDRLNLVEICKGARERLRLDQVILGLVRPIAFPFPVPDSLALEHGRYSVPFLTNAGVVSHFELPRTTVR